jgi:tetratricopeptide (TPR) repeat protein
MNDWKRVLSTLVSLILAAAMVQGQAKEDPTLEQARHARDRGDREALSQAVVSARTRVEQKKDFESYLRLALLEKWMCEVSYGDNDASGVKQAAQAGVHAAEEAVERNSDSSPAHWLLGDLLGQLIPHVLAGGFRYGARATRETDRALSLDPKNTDAYVSRATMYYFTPAMFGGDKRKAVDSLKRAVEIAPFSDAADTAHIWLAQVYAESGKPEEALREIEAAIKLNPERQYARHIQKQINSGKKK